MLNNTFNLTPDKAIKWFESKQLQIGWDWMSVYNQEHAKAFTIAKAMSYDILNDIKQATEQALRQGLTKKQFRLSLENTLKSKGWWGRKNVINPQGLVEKVQLGSPWRLDTIYRTNMQSSYMAGRWQSFQDNKENRPYMKYVAVVDSVTRFQHRQLNKKIYHIDNPIWKTIYPPNGYNCFDDKTEVFTDSGWLLFKDLKGDEKFLSQNPEDRNVEWVKAKNHIKQEVNEQLVHFKSRSMDCMVTKNHDMLVMTSSQRRRNQNLIFKSAIDVSAKSYFTTAVRWGWNGGGVYRHIVYALTTGIVNRYKNGNVKSVEVTDENGDKFIIKGKSSLKHFLADLITSRYIPESDLKDITKYGKGDLFSFLQLYQKLTKSKSNFIKCENNQQINLFSEIALKCGFNPVQKNKSLIELKNNKYIVVPEKELVDYNGFVYCVELEKFHTLWVRRNGKALWSGNCRCRTRALTDKQAKAQGKTTNFKTPDGFPDTGFSNNVGLGNTALNTKMFKSWYKVNDIGVAFANKQIKSYMQQIINAGLFTTFIDLALSNQIGDQMAFGYLSKSQYEVTSQVLKSINSGALNITDSVISSSKISLIDKQNLATYLNGQKDIEVINKRLVIKVKSQTTDKIIKLVFRADSQDLILQSLSYIV